MYDSNLKHKIINSYRDLLIELSQSNKLFTITVTCGASSNKASEDIFRSIYNKVLYKIAKKLSRHSCDARRFHKNIKHQSLEVRNSIVLSNLEQLNLRKDSTAVIDVVSQYECDVINPFTINSTSPHHFHGVIAIPPTLDFKVWNDKNNQLDIKLQKSIDSIAGVASCLIETLRIDECGAWMNYIHKDVKFVS